MRSTRPRRTTPPSRLGIVELEFLFERADREPGEERDLGVDQVLEVALQAAAVGFEHDADERTAFPRELVEGIAQAGADEVPILAGAIGLEAAVRFAYPLEEAGEGMVVDVAYEEGVDEGNPGSLRGRVQEPHV